MKKKIVEQKDQSIKKIIVLSSLFLLFFGLTLFFATKTIERRILNPITYYQKGDANYKVYLKENAFYDEKYLESGHAYIASLIDYIDVNLNYTFEMLEKTKMEFDYRIVGKLSIYNGNGTGKYLEKQYILKNVVTKSLNNSNVMSILENLKIDYDYYNQLANDFRAAYAVDTVSYLDIYLEVKASTDDELDYEINENNNVLLRIPLSEKSVEISLEKAKLNKTGQVTKKGEVIFNIIPLVLEIIFFIPSGILAVLIIQNIFNSISKVSLYDKYVKKILKEYDRLIVESKTKLNLKKYHVIEVDKFDELLDVRDNLKLPIIYLNVKEHEEGIFYIINNDELYKLEIKEKNLEKAGE